MLHVLESHATMRGPLHRGLQSSAPSFFLAANPPAVCSQHTLGFALRRDQASSRKFVTVSAARSDPAGVSRAKAPTSKDDGSAARKEASQMSSGAPKKAWWAGGGRQEARFVLLFQSEHHHL